MTRDIIDINDFIILIESSLPGEETIDLCSFDDEVIGLAFYGAGDVRFEASFPGHDTVESHTKGLCLSFFANSEVRFRHTVLDDKPLQCIVICCSLENIKKLPAEEREVFEQFLPMLVNPQANLVAGPHFLMNGGMLQAVDKIFTTPYTGATRVMFMRSQVTELLSHFFALLTDKQEEKGTDADVQKLLRAKEIITENMESPPTLNELSKLIGLNSYKLKKNFKEMFGMPVFKYLQNERLEKAHELLRHNDTTIQEAAWMVGYESISSFSNAFTKKYGFRPSEVKA